MLLNNLAKCASPRISLFSPTVFSNYLNVFPKNTVTLFSVREMGFRKQYGSEEGHHTKNEVRKEKWIRKRQRRSLGGDYREYQGLPRSVISCGEPLVDGIDWSFADGRPGIPGQKQIKLIFNQKEYASEIKAALDLVNKFEQVNLEELKQEELSVQLKKTLKYKYRNH